MVLTLLVFADGMIRKASLISEKKGFHCWPPGEEGVSKDHKFVFCDLDISSKYL